MVNYQLGKIYKITGNGYTLLWFYSSKRFEFSTNWSY